MLRLRAVPAKDGWRTRSFRCGRGKDAATLCVVIRSDGLAALVTAKDGKPYPLPCPFDNTETRATWMPVEELVCLLAQHLETYTLLDVSKVDVMPDVTAISKRYRGKQACLAVCERIAPDFLAAARELYEADNLLSPNDIPAGVMDEENGVVCRTERHFITLPLKVWEQIEQGAFVGEKLSVPVQLSYLVAMGIHAHNESEKEPSDG